MQTTFVQQSPAHGSSPARNRRRSAATGLQRSGERRPKRSPLGETDARPRGNAGPAGDRALIEALGNSKLFHDYERAFTEATGLPVALRAVESWQLPHHGQRNESPFCSMVLETS